MFLPPVGVRSTIRFAMVATFPISYSAVKAGPHGHIIAIGRDMSKVAQCCNSAFYPLSKPSNRNTSACAMQRRGSVCCCNLPPMPS